MHFLNKRILLSLGVISLVTLSFVGEASNNSTYAQAATASVTFVGPYEHVVLPPAPGLVRAWNQSSRLVYGNPQDFSPLWFDAKSDQIHVDPVSQHGRELLGRVVARSRQARSYVATEQTAQASLAELENLMDALMDLTMTDLVGAQEIILTEVDGALGRAVVTVRTLSPALGSYLEANFPMDKIAVRVDPSEATHARPSDYRDGDVDPFEGGSQLGLVQPAGWIAACTSGFPWVNATHYWILTAGHCASEGSMRVYSDAFGQPTVGTIAASTRENWQNGVGTVALTGQSYIAGDFALVLVSTTLGHKVAPYIFRGPAGHTSTKDNVYGWATVAPRVGDQLCTGGRMTGEMCGGEVYRIRFDEYYGNYDGSARHISSAKKSGQCLELGDSGGPVYTENSSGVFARGILSGIGGGLFGTGNAVTPCWLYFAEILHAIDEFPGTPYVS